jgi:hypothetical protein
MRSAAERMGLSTLGRGGARPPWQKEESGAHCYRPHSAELNEQADPVQTRSQPEAFAEPSDPLRPLGASQEKRALDTIETRVRRIEEADHSEDGGHEQDEPGEAGTGNDQRLSIHRDDLLRVNARVARRSTSIARYRVAARHEAGDSPLGRPPMFSSRIDHLQKSIEGTSIPTAPSVTAGRTGIAG